MHTYIFQLLGLVYVCVYIGSGILTKTVGLNARLYIFSDGINIHIYFSAVYFKCHDKCTFVYIFVYFFRCCKLCTSVEFLWIGTDEQGSFNCICFLSSKRIFNPMRYTSVKI